MNYKISVIIPVYNAEKDLKTAIDSIINQTIGFENIELIIVDDASADNSRNIINDYSQKYSNIKPIFLDKNSGFPGKPRNIGIKNATAEYIVFLDADDEYYSDALEKYYSTITKEKSDFVMGSHFSNLDGEKVKVNILHHFDDTFKNKDLINIDPFENQLNFDRLSHDHIAPWGKIYNKEVIIKNNVSFPEDCLCEDTYFYFNMLINSKKVTLLPNEELYCYNIIEGKDSAIHGHDLKKFNNYFNGFKKLIDLIEQIGFSKEIIISENFSNLLLIFTNLSKDNKKKVISEIYDFEKDMGYEVVINRKEVAILNNLIFKKHFKAAILLSDFYQRLYNNVKIKNLYRRFIYK